MAPHSEFHHSTLVPIIRESHPETSGDGVTVEVWKYIYIYMQQHDYYLQASRLTINSVYKQHQWNLCADSNTRPAQHGDGLISNYGIRLLQLMGKQAR